MIVSIHTNGMFGGRSVARNKYPEETVNQILEASYRLFMEKGYEHTSIQDILGALNGLSKGAIYHHFKSKEDILDAVTDRITQGVEQRLTAIRDEKGMNGKQKLKRIFEASIHQQEQDEVFRTAPNLGDNPRLITMIVNDTMQIVVPEYILPIVEEGIADGSIQTKYPKELSEVVLLVGNIWMNPMIFDNTPSEMVSKFCFFQEMMRALGLDIIDDSMLKRFQELSGIYQENK